MNTCIARPSRCATRSIGRYSPLAPLYNVFFSPLFPARCTSARLQQEPRADNRSCQVRAFHSNGVRYAKPRPPVARPNAWDEEIPATFIQIVDTATKQLQPPRRLKQILRSMDRSQYRIVCMGAIPQSPIDPDWTPVCKIMTKSDAYTQQKTLEQKAKANKKHASGAVSKIIEINWLIDLHDLSIRLERLQGFLEDGRRVEVVFAKKRRSRKATQQECDKVLELVRERVDAVKGTKVVKPLDGEKGGVARMTVDGPKVETSATAKDQVTAQGGQDQ